MPLNECPQCFREFEDDDMVYPLQAGTPYRGYVHDECLAEFLYDKLEPYPEKWSKMKELDGITDE